MTSSRPSVGTWKFSFSSNCLVLSDHVNFFNFPVLIDHDVPEENITLVSLLMAVNGVNTIAYAFKNVKIVTSEVDPSINDAFQIVPGFGNFADRYFGTEPNRI